MPSEVVNGIRRELHAYEENAHLVVKCSRKFHIQLTINGQVYSLPSEQLTFDLGGDKCLLNVKAADSDIWLLGTPMVRSFCHIHHWERRRIGLARPKY